MFPLSNNSRFMVSLLHFGNHNNTTSSGQYPANTLTRFLLAFCVIPTISHKSKIHIKIPITWRLSSYRDEWFIPLSNLLYRFPKPMSREFPVDFCCVVRFYNSFSSVRITQPHRSHQKLTCGFRIWKRGRAAVKVRDNDVWKSGYSHAIFDRVKCVWRSYHTR